MTGMKFGILTVTGRAESFGNGARWYCVCDCGNKTISRGTQLRNGTATCCGCLGTEKFIKLNTKHGMSRQRQYHIYQNMCKRCNAPNSKDYKNYGGRGICYCDKWKTFEGFWEDMREGYSDNLTLERIDNNRSTRT
jgi:hypothetical protein